MLTCIPPSAHYFSKIYWLSHLETQVKVVLRTSAHDTMEAINSVGNTEFGVEQSLNLLLVGKIGLAGDDMFSAFWSLGLHNVSENKMNVGGLGVGEELAGKLKMDLSAVSGRKERGGALTIPPSHPAAPVIRTTLLSPEANPLTAVIVCNVECFDVWGKARLRATVANEKLITGGRDPPRYGLLIYMKYVVIDPQVPARIRHHPTGP